MEALYDWFNPGPDKRSLRWLENAIEKDNVADELAEELLAEIGQEVIRTYDTDKSSREEWETQTENARKVAMQVKEAKTFPWEGCANVKYPLMTVASIQFAARAYPEICKGDQVVKCNVTGDDKDGQKQERADRISTHMSWQLTKQMGEWTQELDKALHIIPIVGCFFRKTYYDGILKRNFSQFILADDVIVHVKARSLELARRVSHRFWLYNNDVWELFKSGVWKEQDLGQPQGKAGELESSTKDVPHEFIEQHRYWDLDGDGIFGETGAAARDETREWDS